MGRIPEFVSRKLASSVVGTPGVDPSGEIIGRSIAGAAGRIADVSFREMAQRQRVLDTVDANQNSAEFGIALDKTTVEVQTEFKDNPVAGVEAFLVQGNNLSNQFLGNVDSESVKQLTTLKYQENINRRLNSMRSWAANRQVAIAGSKITSNINLLATQAAAMDDPNALTSIFSEAAKTIDASIGVLSAKEAAKFQKLAPEAIAKGYFYGQLERDPVHAGQLLDEGFFSKQFTPEEINGFKKDTQKAIEKKGETDNYNLLIDVSRSHENLAKQYKEGTLTVGEIDQLKINFEDQEASAEELKFLDIMRDLVIETADLDAVDNAEEYSKLMDNWHQLQVKKDGTSAKGALEDILRFQTQAGIAHRSKVITKEKFNQFLRLTATPVNDKIETEKGERGGIFGLGGPASKLDTGYIKIVNWLKTNKLDKNFDVKKHMLTSLVSSFDKRREANPDIKFAEVDAISADIISREQRRVNDTTGSIPKEGELKIDKFGRKALIFPDGTYKRVN